MSLLLSMVLVQPTASLANQNNPECCAKAEACVNVLAMCHQQYLKLHDFASQQQAAIEQLALDNKQLADLYAEASARDWWERPEVVIPLSIAVGFLGGVWVAR